MLKRVTAPFPPSRTLFFKDHIRGSPELSPDQVGMNYHWDGHNVYHAGLRPTKGKPIGSPLIDVLSLMRVPYREIETPEELRWMHIEGEFVGENGVAPEILVPRLQEILREELQLPLRLNVTRTERDVIIVGGKYQSTPRSHRKLNEVELFAPKPNKDVPVWRFDTTFEDFLIATGSHIGHRFVNELAETPKGNIVWFFGPRLNNDSHVILPQITAQTGLTLKTEKFGSFWWRRTEVIVRSHAASGPALRGAALRSFTSSTGHRGTRITPGSACRPAAPGRH